MYFCPFAYLERIGEHFLSKFLAANEGKMAHPLAGQSRQSYCKTSRYRFNDYDHDQDRLRLVTTSSSRAPRLSKWYNEPKIPIHMNMSTMIRMKSKEKEITAKDDQEKNVVDRKVSTFSHSNSNPRRMFDYMQEKFEVIRDRKFVGSSYTKNLFWRVVAEHGNDGRTVSANPCGDGFSNSGMYQRVAAINVKGVSGCNLQYIEKISIQSKTKDEKAESGAGHHLQIRTGEGSMASCLNKLGDLSITKGNQGCGESNSEEWEKCKRKFKKITRKPVVVTCLKNSSIKYVRR